MKHLIYIIAFISISTFAQNKYLTKTGTVNFEASIPSFEEVAAINNAVTAIINTENNEFAALVFVKGFRFKNALMEEHFNENYAESDKYPKATFKGVIIKVLDKHQINGELIFHGKTKQLKDIPIVLITENETVKMSGSFVVNASGFDIKIPKVVKNKVSETIKISFNFTLKEK